MKVKPDDWVESKITHAIAEGINRVATAVYKETGKHLLVSVALGSEAFRLGVPDETVINTAVGPVEVRVATGLGRGLRRTTNARAVAERVLEQLCDPDAPLQVLGPHVDLLAFIEGANTALSRHPPDDIRDRLETAIRQARRMLAEASAAPAPGWRVTAIDRAEGIVTATPTPTYHPTTGHPHWCGCAQCDILPVNDLGPF